MSNKHITVLGAGAYGSALSQVLTENGHDVVMYDPILKVDLKTCLKDAEILVVAVPSGVIAKVLPTLPHDLPLIVATKGLFDDQLFQTFADYMIISGPGFAQDIKAHHQTLLTATDQRIIDLFTRDYLTFDYTNDRIGVLMCGALKNVYAILAGLENLQPDTPEQEKFLTEVAGEMQALLSANQADSNTVNLACGQGDLKLTCAEPSRNYEFGQILRIHPDAKPSKTVEGVSALRRIKRGDIVVPKDTPKLHHLMEVGAKWN